MSIRKTMSAREKAITKTAPEPQRGVRFLEIECRSRLQKFESYGGSSRRNCGWRPGIHRWKIERWNSSMHPVVIE